MAYSLNQLNIERKYYIFLCARIDHLGLLRASQFTWSTHFQKNLRNGPAKLVQRHLIGPL